MEVFGDRNGYCRGIWYTLNVGWETVFINLVLGFGTAIGKGMSKDYEMKYAFLNYTIPMLIAGIITDVCISLSIA